MSAPQNHSTWIPPELERLADAYAITGKVEIAGRLRSADLDERGGDDEEVCLILREVREAIESAAALGGPERACQLLNDMLDGILRHHDASRAAWPPADDTHAVVLAHSQSH